MNPQFLHFFSGLSRAEQTFWSQQSKEQIEKKSRDLELEHARLNLIEELMKFYDNESPSGRLRVVHAIHKRKNKNRRSDHFGGYQYSMEAVVGPKDYHCYDSNLRVVLNSLDFDAISGMTSCFGLPGAGGVDALPGPSSAKQETKYREERIVVKSLRDEMIDFYTKLSYDNRCIFRQLFVDLTDVIAKCYSHLFDFIEEVSRNWELESMRMLCQKFERVKKEFQQKQQQKQ